MAINEQIGWSQESKLLRIILKQLEHLTQTMGGGSVTTTTLSPAVQQAIIAIITQALSDDFAATNPTTIPLTLAMLNSGYPTVDVGFRVICMSISTGAVIYTKTATNTWARQNVTNVA